LPAASSKLASSQLHQQLQSTAFQSQTSNFVAPTLTARNQQQSSFIPHQTARPSAPIPPSTPPSSSTVGIQQSQQSSILGYSPIHQPQSQQTGTTTIIRSQPQMMETSPQRQHLSSLADQHQQQEQQLQQSTQLLNQQPQSTPPQHYYVTTMDQQPPILQPQQQPTAGYVINVFFLSNYCIPPINLLQKCMKLLKSDNHVRKKLLDLEWIRTQIFQIQKVTLRNFKKIF
jgi:hypothetical protein